VGHVTPVLDTNILIDYLSGIAEARAEFSRYEKVSISTVTWAEVMVGCQDGEESQLRGFLQRFEVIAFTLEIADIAWRLRRASRMRLPDAVIWATAKHTGTLLITRNTSDFPEGEPDIRIPYRLRPTTATRG
jgi:predicted nucleic acid-binding protein